MRRLTLALLTTFVLLILSSTTLTAQEQTMKIVFVDSQVAINAHPAGQEAQVLQEQARLEVLQIRNDIESLAQRIRAGQQLSANESERYQLLLTTLESIQQRYEADISQKVQPAIESVNEVIRTLAIENGYSVVFDRGIAAQGLVVFAQEGLDITPLVLERLQSR
ncbi:MAG: OmpH family outer membrane protein [Trueperaceae bacterium]|nr:MAG: OmpH family outer membrane protein [Trueperaceae bacterium]